MKSSLVAAFGCMSLFACGDDTLAPDTTTTTSTTGAGAAGGEDAAGGTGGATTGTGGEGGGTPQTEGCKHATLLEEFEPDAYFAQGDLPGDTHSYFSVPVVGGELRVVWLEHHPQVEKPVDLVLRIWSADGTTLLATAAAEYPVSGQSIDADLMTRFAEDGFVCGEVLTAAEWLTGEAELVEDGRHGLLIARPEDYYHGYVVFDEEPNDLVSPQAIDLAANFLLPIYGTFSSTTDVDVYEFQPAYSAIEALFMPTRPPTETEDGWGHDAVLPVVSILDDSGTVILRRRGADALETCETGNQCLITMPAVPGATYRMVVESPPGANAVDPFYGVSLASFDFAGTVENPDDATTATNDGYATAEAIGSGLANRDIIEYFFEGELHDGDEDWWYLGPGDGDLSGDCRSLTHGSGVDGFTVEVRSEASPDGAPLSTATEGVAAPAAWGAGTNEPSVPGPGGHFIRITSTGFNPAVEGRNYRCRVFR